MIAPAGGKPKKNGKHPKKKPREKKTKIETPPPVQAPQSPLPGDNYRFGRPSKLTKSLLDKIVLACRLGATNEQLSEIFDINPDTIATWMKNKHFSEAITRAKAEPDDKMEASLFKRGLGYTYVEEVATKHGVEKIHRRMHGDVDAIKFWLKNRRKERWRDKEDTGPAPIASITINNIVVSDTKQIEKKNYEVEAYSPPERLESA